MSEHTPGEWEAVKPRETGRRCRVVAKEKLGGGKGAISWHLATIENGAPGDTLETEWANAQLFAASKDLLAACKTIVDAGDKSPPVELIGRIASSIEQARAAIAKAEGT